MGLLDELLGGGERRSSYEDFAARYEQGHPHEGYDDDEVAARYGQVAGEVDDDTYFQAARDSYGRLDPDERAHFGSELYEQARGSGIDADYDGSPDPDSLARLTTSVRRQNPSLLESLLGGPMGGGGVGGGGMGGMGGMGAGGMGGLGAVLGGLAGGGGLGGGLGGPMGGGGMGGGNPVAKAVLAGITAMAARRMMSR